MARRPSKHLREPRPLALSSAETSAHKRDGVWVTRPITGIHALKVYTCPGCNKPIGVGVAHLVVWPSVPPLGTTSGIGHRRHWHRTCWQRRP